MAYATIDSQVEVTREHIFCEITLSMNGSRTKFTPYNNNTGIEKKKIASPNLLAVDLLNYSWDKLNIETYPLFCRPHSRGYIHSRFPLRRLHGLVRFPFWRL